MKPADMADYYTVLARKIRETNDDPAKMREVVYEAARLALRWQVQEQWPRLSVSQSKYHIGELEDAIARLEADAAGSGGRGKRELGQASEGSRASQQSSKATIKSHEDFAESGQASEGSRASRQSFNATIKAEKDFVPDVVEEPCSEPQDPFLAELADLVEVVAAGPGEFGKRNRVETAIGFKASQQGRNGPVESEEEDDASKTVEEPYAQPRDLPPAKPADLKSVDTDGLGQRGERDRGKIAADFEAQRRSHNASVKSLEDDVPDTVEEPYAQHRAPPPAKLADLEPGAAARAERGKRDQMHFEANRQSRSKTAADFEAHRRSRNMPVESDEEKDDTPDEVEEPHLQPWDLPGRGKRDQGKIATDFEAHRRSRGAPIEPEEAEDDPDPVEEVLPQPWDDPSPAAQANLAASRELVLIRDQARRPAYRVKPADFVSPEITYRLPAAPHSRASLVVAGLLIAFQLVIAVLAVAALYVAMSGRNSPVQTAEEMPLPGGKLSSAAVAAAPIAAPVAAAPVAAPLPFPRPTVYGVYAISDNRLIELEQVQATPVDPRTRTQLQIIKPGRNVVAPQKLAFVVFRRDLVSNAPEKVPLRIAARIAHSMNFDATGKAVVTTPATATWFIREQGYNLRVSPVPESAEMVMLQPENPELFLPSGRYELMLGGQPYDFVVAGEVTDPAHCVEGVATVRGPVFYECKPVL